jgi:hypothetical protein
LGLLTTTELADNETSTTSLEPLSTDLCRAA